MPSRNLTNVFDYGTGNATRSDAKGFVVRNDISARISTRYSTLKKQQKKAPWRKHQSVAHTKQGRCCWRDCPGKKTSKAKQPRPYDGFHICEECTALRGKDVHFCNSSKKGVPVLCHMAYHNKHHSKNY